MTTAAHLSISDIAALFPKVKPRGKVGFMAPCPAHGDDKFSLSVTEAPDKKILLKCFAGCAFDDIISTLGIEASQLFPESNNAPRSKNRHANPVLVATYPYHDADGVLKYVSIRGFVRCRKSYKWK